MYKISFQGKQALSQGTETVLETFLRHSIEVPFSCRKGVCDTCLLQMKNGKIPVDAQQGLSDIQRKNNYFFPCMCIPESDMELLRPPEQKKVYQARICTKRLLSKNVCELELVLDEPLVYHAGQHIQLKRTGSEVSRPYSLASVPVVDHSLILHIKYVPNGQFSQWIFDELQEGDQVSFYAPQGDCYYHGIAATENLLLLGASTGLAPLIGIVREALLLHEHKGNIFLYHGSSEEDELYLHQELMALDAAYSHFHYFPCISGEAVSTGFYAGRVDEVAFEMHREVKDYRIFICGRPEVVAEAQAKAIEAGGVQACIFTDLFEYAYKPTDFQGSENGQDTSQPPVSYEFVEEDPQFPPADLEMWEALDNGELLTEILTDFYQKVYQDPLLLPFFESVAIERVIQKQYSFLYQAFSGKAVFLGEMPRNSHNWMVITDEIFDYREALFEASIRKFGLADHLITRWMNLHEQYRDRMVKTRPWSKIIDGEVFPLGGFEEVIASLLMLCDNCEGEIQIGENVRYHERLGKTYCSNCYVKV